MTAVTEIAVISAVSFVDMYKVIASLTSDEELTYAIIADEDVSVLVGFVLWQGFAAVFTINGFHC